MYLHLFTAIFLFFFTFQKTLAQNNLVKGKMLEKPLLEQDFRLLEKALTEIHPGLYRYNTPETIQSAFEALRNNLPQQVSEAEAMKRLAQTLAKIRCGHTYINPWNMNGELRKRLFGAEIYLPIGFQIVGGRFFITENASKSEKIRRGAEIISINGHTTSTIYDSLKTMAKSDGNNLAPYDNYLSLDNYQDSMWEAFDLYFPLFFPLQGNAFEIEFRNFGEKEESKIIVHGISKKERETRMREKFGDEAVDVKKWKLDILSDELAVMKLGTFAIWNWTGFDQKKWFKDAFQKLNDRKVKNLVVDIRGNGGGLGEPRDELLSYLTDKKLECEEDGKVLIRTTKVNEELHPYCDTWAKPILKGIPQSMYTKYDEDWYEFKEKGDCSTIKPKKSNFKGEVYVFGNGSNVSATYLLLDKLKRNGLATLVGSVSGGNLQGINGGDYIFFRMPYSKMEVDIPLKYFAPKNPQPDTGIEPDYTVTVSQRSIAEGADEYLNWVKADLKNK